MTAATSTSVESLRQCQAVLLPALFGATLEGRVHVLGVGRATVARLQATFRKHGSALPPAACTGWGDDILLTPEEANPSWKAAGWPTPPQATWWWFPRFERPWRNGLASRSNRRWCTGGLARHGWRKVAPEHTPPQEQTRGSGGLEKKLPGALDTLLTRDAVKGRPVWVMFQDQGSLWTDGADSTLLGTVPAAPGGRQWLRAAVSVCRWSGQPAGSELDWMICPAMNTEHGSLPGSSQRGSPP